MQQHPSTPVEAAICFVRHGATAPNLAGRRCGGDYDPPLTDIGHQQVEALARQLAVLSVPVGVVVTSNLQRTRTTAAIIAAALGGLPVVVQPAWAERSLGAWNLRLIDETQDALLAGHTPPGGESNADFTQRIAAAARGLGPLLARRPLLVGSKGVARVMGELCGLPDRVELDNSEMCRFDLTAVLHREPAWEMS